MSIEYPTRVFTGATENKEDVIEFANTARTILTEMDLKHSESIVIHNNQVSAIISPERDIVSTVDKLIEIIWLNKNKNEDGEKVNDLPDNLKDLYSLFDKYSLSDDQERNELIESLTTKEINQLIDTVDKRLDEINVFLDSFDDRPLTEDAQLLMSLTELVMELKNIPRRSA